MLVVQENPGPGAGELKDEGSRTLKVEPESGTPSRKLAEDVPDPTTLPHFHFPLRVSVLDLMLS